MCIRRARHSCKDVAEGNLQVPSLVIERPTIFCLDGKCLQVQILAHFEIGSGRRWAATKLVFQERKGEFDWVEVRGVRRKIQ